MTDPSEILARGDADLYHDKRRSRDAHAAWARRAARSMSRHLREHPREKQPWHSTYTLASVAVAAMFALRGLAGLLGATTDAEIAMCVVHTALGAAVAVGIGAAGRRTPRWVILAWIGLESVITFVHVSVSETAGPLVTTIFGFVPIAVLLGCFVRRRAGRPLFAAYCAAVVVGMVIAQPLAFGELGPVPLVAGVFTSWYLMELVALARSSVAEIAERDPLTDTLNRLGFETHLARALRRARRRGEDLSVVVVDFDGFKHVNDTRGHAYGDEVLRGSVATWRRMLRRDDVIARAGGDEFVLVLPGVDRRRASEIASRLASADAHSWSWGVASLREGGSREGRDGLMTRADAALRLAKQSH